MEAESARGYRDDSPRLPRLSLGLSSVRFIVNKLETEYTRVIATAALNTSRELVKYDPNIDEGYHDYDDSSLDRSRERVWRRLVVNLAVALSRCIPSVTFGNFGVLAVATGLFAPKMISYLVVYPFCRLVFGTLYPAYASYKAVRTKNLKEYVKWMMYWIVFALFTCTETFTDVFLSWFPFYYEVKIVLVLWLLSPATKGSSILYRKFVHPALCRREQEIDEYIAKAKDQGYHTVLNLGTKGVNYATTVIMQTAIKGGGGLVQQLRKSYSLSDLTECEPREERGSDEADDVLAEPRVIRRVVKSSGYNTRRSASESNSRSPMYFPEVDVDVRPARSRTDEPDFSHIKSTEDISSGYSSADNSASLTRTGSLGARARARAAKTTVTTIKRPQAAEESEVIIEEVTDDDTFEYANMPPLVALPSPLFMSHTDPPFLYQYVGDQVKIIQVLGNYPVRPTSNLQTNNTDHRDQNEISSNKASLNKDATDVDTKTEISEYEPIANNSENDLISDIPNKDIVESVTTEDKSENVPIETTLPECDIPVDNTGDENINNGSTECNNPFTENKENDAIETASLDTSTCNNDNDYTESDDEASFGTPDNSPKSKRKTSKGKYGKAKAPAPPPPHREVANDKLVNASDNTESIPTEESLFLDIMKIVPHTSLPGRVKNAQIVNPIAENKRRHKSKSPCRTPKSSSSGIGKLLHLPSKLAFWHKTEENTTKTDSISISSDDRSRRSSTVEMAFDDFQSCTDLNVLVSKNVPNVVTEHMRDEPNTNENISQDILHKSDTLQKLIDAKLESHPEYKTVPLHEEIPTTSKSTDV